MTVGCAQCHDHKYDPIPTKDYYSLLGVFRSTKTVEHPLVGEAEVARYKAQKKKVDDLKEILTDYLAEQTKQLTDLLARDTAKYLVATVTGDAAGLDAETLGRWKTYLADDNKEHAYLKGWYDLLKTKPTEAQVRAEADQMGQERGGGGEERGPVGIGVGVGADGELEMGRVEGDQFDFGGWRGEDAGRGGECFLAGVAVGGEVGVAVGGADEFDAAGGIGVVVAEDGAEHFGVADEGADVVLGEQGGGEEADLHDGAGDAGGGDVVADLEGAEDDEEGAGGEVGKQSGPGGADGQTGAGDEGGEGGRLDTEDTHEDDGEGDVERDGEGVAGVADDGVVDLLFFETGDEDAEAELDEGPADDPDGECADEFEPVFGEAEGEVIEQGLG
jgi:hypothetical protein